MLNLNEAAHSAIFRFFLLRVLEGYTGYQFYQKPINRFINCVHLHFIIINNLGFTKYYDSKDLCKLSILLCLNNSIAINHQL